MSKATKQPALIVLSIVALLNVIVVPVFDVWGGLFAKNATKFTFFHVIESIFEDPDNWNLWVVQITLSILLPSIFMFIFSLVGARKLYITSTIVGIVLWFRIIVQFISQKGVSYVFDFDDCSISIGTWIAIVLFVIALITSLVSKGKTNGNSVSYITNNVTPNHETEPVVQMKFCPKCGAEIKGNISFCGKCGQKLVSSDTSENNTTYEN